MLLREAMSDPMLENYQVKYNIPSVRKGSWSPNKPLKLIFLDISDGRIKKNYFIFICKDFRKFSFTIKVKE